MPVEIYTADPPGTLAVECREVLTVEDARYILEHCLAAVRADPVHFLIDCSRMETLAPGVLNILAGFDAFLNHPNTGLLAFVTRSALLKTSVQLLFGSSELRIFEDRDAAAHFLDAHTG